MMRLMLGLAVLAGCVVLGAEAVLAEEKTTPLEARPLTDMTNELPRYAAIIEAFGTGNLDTALELTEAELPGPFTQEARAQWRNAFTQLSELNAKFESVDFIGYQPISSASRTLVLIGHGELGPIQFRVRVFRYQDRWRISNLSYQGNWDQIESDTSFSRLQSPVTFPLATQPVAQTED